MYVDVAWARWTAMKLDQKILSIIIALAHFWDVLIGSFQSWVKEDHPQLSKLVTKVRVWLLPAVSTTRLPPPTSPRAASMPLSGRLFQINVLLLRTLILFVCTIRRLWWGFFESRVKLSPSWKIVNGAVASSWIDRQTRHITFKSCWFRKYNTRDLYVKLTLYCIICPLKLACTSALTRDRRSRHAFRASTDTAVNDAKTNLISFGSLTT